MVGRMETPDTTAGGENEDSGPEGMLIGQRLHELAEALGLNQRQLALTLKIDPRHFNGLWLDKRAAGLPTITQIARLSGRSIGWICGEEAARPLIGTVSADGIVSMTTETISQGVICFIEATGLFEAGQRVFIDPTSAYAVGRWLLVRPRGSPTSWVAWARLREDGTRMLDRTDGERLEYQEGRHEIRGVIAGVLVPPPVPESARR